MINNERITFSEWVKLQHEENFAFTALGKLKKAISGPNTWETMKKLEKLLSEYKGNKSNIIYKFAVEKYNKLKKKEKSLIKEKKLRLKKKYADDSNIEADIKTITISKEELDILISDLYASYIDSKKFKKKCKALKKILEKFLSTYKAMGKKQLYKKYYSNYIDVCEYLRMEKD